MADDKPRNLRSKRRASAFSSRPSSPSSEVKKRRLSAPVQKLSTGLRLKLSIEQKTVDQTTESTLPQRTRSANPDNDASAENPPKQNDPIAMTPDSQTPTELALWKRDPPLDVGIAPLFTILDTHPPPTDLNPRKRGDFIAHASKYHPYILWSPLTDIQSPNDVYIPPPSPSFKAKLHFISGSRFIPPTQPKGASCPVQGPPFDQATLLILKLRDRRPDPRTGLPRNTPIVVKHPVPKDWSCAATIRQLNIDRAQNLRRVTLTTQRKRCLPYEREEREWIAAYKNKNKNKAKNAATADIDADADAPLTKTKGKKRRDFETRFNAQFEGKMVGNHPLPRDARSQASLDAEYSRHKRLYDAGGVPEEVPKKPAKDAFGWREQRVLHALLKAQSKSQSERQIANADATIDKPLLAALNAALGAKLGEGEVTTHALAQVRKEYKAEKARYDRVGYEFPRYPPKGAKDNFCFEERRFIARLMGREQGMMVESLTEALNERFMGEVVRGVVRGERTVGSVRLEMERFRGDYERGVVPVEKEWDGGVEDEEDDEEDGVEDAEGDV